MKRMWPVLLPLLNFKTWGSTWVPSPVSSTLSDLPVNVFRDYTPSESTLFCLAPTQHTFRISPWSWLVSHTTVTYRTHFNNCTTIAAVSFRVPNFFQTARSHVLSCYFVFMVPSLLLSLCDCLIWLLSVLWAVWIHRVCSPGFVEYENFHLHLLNALYTSCQQAEGNKTALACPSPRNGSLAPTTFHVADHPPTPHVIPQLGLGVGLFWMSTEVLSFYI